MKDVFDIAAKVEDQRMQDQKEFEKRHKELRQELIEGVRHKENTRLAKIGIAVAVIALIVSLIALFK